MKQPDIALQPCPHCGSASAPMFWSNRERMDDYECDCTEADAGNDKACAVVCDASTGGRGGCGASGGFRPTEQEAADAWNRRPNA
jgi:hypothetical protein